MASDSVAGFGLPASRADALSIIILGILSAFTGAAPAKGNKTALIVTTLANIWNITSSVLTLNDIIHNSNGIDTYLWLFLLSVLALSVVTSALRLVSFAIDKRNRVVYEALVGGLVMVLVVFVFGHVQFLLAYYISCDDAPSDQIPALCDHPGNRVVGVVLASVLVGLLLVAFVFTFSIHTSNSLCQNTYWCGLTLSEADEEERELETDAIDELELVDIHMAYEAKLESDKATSRFKLLLGLFVDVSLTRMSALTKAFLFAVYLGLVNDDLDWEFTINRQDGSLWITGQWAKQGAAIANNFLNAWC